MVTVRKRGGARSRWSIEATGPLVVGREAPQSVVLITLVSKKRWAGTTVHVRTRQFK